MRSFLGYELNEHSSYFGVRGITPIITLKIRLSMIFNFPFRFHTCQECGKKWICGNISLSRCKNCFHEWCSEHWLNHTSDHITTLEQDLATHERQNLRKVE